MIKVLVTGANGQLGKCLQDVAKSSNDIIWDFKTSSEFDITKENKVKEILDKGKYDYLVNCAAYTAVDKAEEESDKAFLVNAEAVRFLSHSCLENNTILIHISTDFVFDGKKNLPYTEEDMPNPINVYGASKLLGEKHIQEILTSYFILRTSWVYSEYGNNFVKTMLRLAETHNELNVVSDQIGSPTYAGDLAEFIALIINDESRNYGLFHYSNDGQTSWYELSSKIFELSNNNITVNPISTDSYPFLAKRPLYSVMNNSHVINSFKLTLKHWTLSLIENINDCIN